MRLKTLATILFPGYALVRAVRYVATPLPRRPAGSLLDFAGSRRGIVTECKGQRLSDTHQSNGIGVIDWRTGLTYSAPVRTDVLHFQEFALDGKQKFELRNRHDVFVAIGHEVGVLRVGGRTAYVRNYDTGDWWELTKLPNMLPLIPPARLWVILGSTLFLAPFCAILVLMAVACLLAILVPALGERAATIILSDAGGMAFLLCGAPALCLLWWFWHGRRVNRENAALWAQGRQELADECHRYLGLDLRFPAISASSGAFLLVFAAVFLALAVPVYRIGTYGPEPPSRDVSPSPDSKLVVGSWRAGQSPDVMHYSPDGTYTVTLGIRGQVLESGRWKLDRHTLGYVPKDQVYGWHHIQRIDDSTMVWKDGLLGSDPITYSRVK